MIGRTPNPNCGNFFSGPKQEKVGFKLSYHKANYLHKKTLNDRRSRLQIQANTGQAGREDRGEVWQRRNGDNKEGDQRRRGEPSGTKGSADANQIVRSRNANADTNIKMNLYTNTIASTKRITIANTNTSSKQKGKKYKYLYFFFSIYIYGVKIFNVQ